MSALAAAEPEVEAEAEAEGSAPGSADSALGAEKAGAAARGVSCDVKEPPELFVFL